MELILCFGIFFITLFIGTIIFGMIVLSAFFGIPQTLKLKKQKILLESASIKPYLTTIVIWMTIILVILLILANILKEIYFIEIVWGLIISFFYSFKSLSKSNYKINMEELLNIQAHNLNPKFINFESNNLISQNKIISPEIPIENEIQEQVNKIINKNNELKSLEENAPINSNDIFSNEYDEDLEDMDSNDEEIK